MKILASIVFFLFLLSCAPQEASEEEGIVKEIIDGDTYLIQTDFGLKKVRLLGVDYPDLKKEKIKRWFDQGLSYETIKSCYQEGKRMLEKELKNQKVTLVYDPYEQEQDEYGRTLAYAYFQNKSLSQLLVEEGYAIMFDPTLPLCQECASLKQKEKQKGCLWE